MVGTMLNSFLTNIRQQVLQIIELPMNVSNHIVLSTDLNHIRLLNQQLNNDIEQILEFADGQQFWIFNLSNAFLNIHLYNSIL